MFKEIIAKIFWKNVNAEGDCWLWLGKTDKDGYGLFRIGNGYKKAHRLSYALHHDGLPTDKSVCHTCDNRQCVNPGHLFIGTPKENSQDAYKKGRLRSLFPQKISDSDVAAIRSSGMSKVQLAEKFGVTRAYIGMIINNRYRILKIKQSKP